MRKFILTILLILLIIPMTSQIVLSQDFKETTMMDEFGKICYEDFSARYDGFAYFLYNNPSVKGVVIFYGDKTIEGTNLNFIKALKEYALINRGINKSRFTLLRGDNQNEMKIQFWIVPTGSTPPKVEKAFEKEKISITSRFDKNFADFYKSEGKLEIYQNGFYELGCDFSPNVSEYSKTLLSDKNLTGYLVIYGNKKDRAERVVKFAVNDLVKNHKVPRNRLKTIYGGKSEEPQIEFWFVPKKDKPPVGNSK